MNSYSTDFIERMKFKVRYALRIRKPIFFYRVFVNYIRFLFTGKAPLQYVDFSTGYDCNLKCQHCFNKSMITHSDKERLTVDEYKKIAKEFIKQGTVHFSFQGGELFLYDDFEDIIKAFKPRRSYISITTNGTMLNKEKIRHLKKLGVDKLNISLDSFDADEHDKFRGVAGTYNKAMNTINEALENGLDVTILTTVTHENTRSEGFRKLVEFAVERNITLNPIYGAPVGNWEGQKDVMLQKEDKDYLLEIRKRYPNVRRDMDANYLKWGCGAVKEVLYITPYGEVLPCPFLHINLGNLKDESLESIRKRSLKFKEFSTYRQECLAAEDLPFLEKYLKIVDKKGHLPVHWKELF